MLSRNVAARQRLMVREDAPPYGGESLGDALRPARWTYAPHTDIPRQLSDVMVEPWLREALIRLNPDDCRAARPCRRGHLQPARLHPLGAGRRPGARQREFYGLAAR